jgi:transposase
MTKISNVVRVGLDIAKDVFQIHAVDRFERVCLIKQVSRSKLMEVIIQLPPCIIGMEACSGSHYWAKQFEKYGHTVKLLAAHRVKPFIASGNKDDKIDAEAICVAAGRPEMKTVPSKSYEQLEIQSMHRYRQHLTKTITALSNQLRGFLIEYGITMPKGIRYVHALVPNVLEDAENGMSTFARILFQNIYQELQTADRQLTDLDKKLSDLCKTNDACRRVSKIPGVGPVTATALFAAMGNGKQFKNGREAAACFGMIPRHKGTGGKTFNGRLSRKGSRYLKTMAILGGRSVFTAIKKKQSPGLKNLLLLEERKNNTTVAVALAHRNIRIAWALLSRNEEYKSAA